MDLTDHTAGTQLDPSTGQSTGGPDTLTPQQNTESASTNQHPPNDCSSSLHASNLSNSATTLTSAALPTTTTLTTPVRAPKDSARYEEQKGDTPEYRGYTNHAMQSSTFKNLQKAMAAGEEWNSNLSRHAFCISLSCLYQLYVTTFMHIISIHL